MAGHSSPVCVSKQVALSLTFMGGLPKFVATLEGAKRMLNLLGRARKGSTFSPSEGGGYKLPPTRDTTAPSAPRGKAPARPYKDAYEKYLEGERKKYRAKEQRELERRFRAFQKTMEDIQDMAETYREPLEFAVDLTPWGSLRDLFKADHSFRVAKPTTTYEVSGLEHATHHCGPTPPTWTILGYAWSWWSGVNVSLCGVGGQPTISHNSFNGLTVPPGTLNYTVTRMAVRTVNYEPDGARGSHEEMWGFQNIPLGVPRPKVVVTRVPAGWKVGQIDLPRWPGYKPDLTPATGRVPAPKPYERPAIVSTEAGGRMRHTRGYHVLGRPGPRTKEVKKRMHNAFGPLLQMVTEGVEWIGMMHDNLPKHLQAKGDYDRFGTYKGKGKGDPTPQQQAAAVYRHINEVDIPGLLRDIVANHFEDKFFGKLGKAGGKLARDNNWLAGPQFGGAM